MTTAKKTEGSKLGKRNEALFAQKFGKNPLFQANRLDGKVKSMGLKNNGPQMKRGKRGDR